MNISVVEQIDAILPQTQCQQCGFKGCKPYAIAISQQQADINQCPPGGQKGIQALSELLGIAEKPLNPEFGEEKPRSIAVIIEEDCIGCTKCLPPCPVDAIIGASKQMHTVISEQCTGCELCISPCPVDCIVMQPVDENDALRIWNIDKANAARQRYLNKMQREQRLKAEKIERLKKQKLAFKNLKTNKQ
jgi:electron transport complex protein RnfB